MIKENLIEFSIHPNLSKLNNIKPFPIKHSLPDWYKKLEKHDPAKFSIKGCIPFLDGISAGYALPLPQDFIVDHNFYDQEKESHNTCYKFSLSDGIHESMQNVYNINVSKDSHHPVEQIGGNNFFSRKNANNHVIKILNPWKIKTPKGYSCLFVSPFYSEMDYFHIISAIVDTDKFDDYINFPIILNNDKYPSFKKVFKQGTPYVQIIPFKRDSWKINLTHIKNQDNFFKLHYFTKMWNRYRDLIWEKKSWK